MRGIKSVDLPVRDWPMTIAKANNIRSWRG